MKPDAKKRGPKTKFSKAKTQVVAKCATALKKVGGQPAVASVASQCPAAATDPSTGGASTSPTITRVFKTMCYDVKPSEPWAFLSPYQKTALPQPLIEQRLA